MFRVHFSLDNGLDLVCTMVWYLSEQRSFQSGTGLIRGGFERTSSSQWTSSRLYSDQRSLRSGMVWLGGISSVTSNWAGFWYDSVANSRCKQKQTIGSKDIKSKDLISTSQVEIQKQIELWSDPLECTPVCSHTDITGCGHGVQAHKSLDHGLI